MHNEMCIPPNLDELPMRMTVGDMNSSTLLPKLTSLDTSTCMRSSNGPFADMIEIPAAQVGSLRTPKLERVLLPFQLTKTEFKAHKRWIAFVDFAGLTLDIILHENHFLPNFDLLK
jgi:hypothetical protein